MNSFKKIFKNIYFIGQFPNIDWQRTLITFIIFAFAMIAWNVYTFVSVKNEVIQADADIGNARLAAETRDREIDELLAVYELREQYHLQLQSEIIGEPIASSTKVKKASDDNVGDAGGVEN